MQVQLQTAAAPRPETVAVVVLDPSGQLDPDTAAMLPQPLREALGGLDDWPGVPDSFQIHVVDQVGMRRLVAIRPRGHGAQSLCEAFVSAGSTGLLAGELAIYGPWSRSGATDLRAAAEGLHLGAYRFDVYLSRPRSDEPVAATFVVGAAEEPGRERFEEALATAKAYADATNWSRTLVNTPPDDSTPDKLATMIAGRLSDLGVDVHVWSTTELERRAFGGVLGVGRGSAHPPCLVELAIEAGYDDAPIVLCGKGVTFDAGGLSIKNDRTQQWMKADMGGAAAVAATMEAVARAGLAVNVRALLPLAENLPSASAIHPGDVLRHPDGSTTEVTNTDAEGRLILADTLAYANTLRPSVVLDIATLTSGILGSDLWMLFTPDDALADELLEAGVAAHDPGWRLPLLTAMARPLCSHVADRKNYDFDSAAVDTLSAATYLQGFTGGAPWAHLDIVGSAFRRVADHWPVGATGSPTRTLLRFLEGRAEIGARGAN